MEPSGIEPLAFWLPAIDGSLTNWLAVADREDAIKPGSAPSELLDLVRYMDYGRSQCTQSDGGSTNDAAYLAIGGGRRTDCPLCNPAVVGSGCDVGAVGDGGQGSYRGPAPPR